MEQNPEKPSRNVTRGFVGAALFGYIVLSLTFCSFWETWKLAPHADALGVSGNPFGLALYVAAPVAFMIAVDLYLPLGKSNIGTVIDLAFGVPRTVRRIGEGLVADEGWFLRVAVTLAMVVVTSIITDSF